MNIKLKWAMCECYVWEVFPHITYSNGEVAGKCGRCEKPAVFLWAANSKQDALDAFFDKYDRHPEPINGDEIMVKVQNID